MKHARVPCVLIATAAAAFGSVPAVAGQTAPGDRTPRVLVLDTLEQRPVVGLSLDQSSLRFRDADGRAQSLDRSRVLAVTPAPIREHGDDAARAEQFASTAAVVELQNAGWLETTSGERLPGSLITTADADDESLAWQSLLWGPVQFSLEAVRRMELRPLAPGVAEPDDLSTASGDDRVTLINADRLTGFVESIGSTVSIESDGRRTQVPVDRVARIEVANPSEPAAGIWVWLYTGAVAAVESVQIAADQGPARLVGNVTALSDGRRPSVEIPASSIRAINFDIQRLRPLAIMPFAVIDSPAARRWVPPPRIHSGDAPLGAADVELTGPLTVEWDLPPASTRFAATLELPADSRIWGSYSVRIEASRGGARTILASLTFDDETPRHDVNLAFPEGGGETTRLRMSIDAGPSGPVQDRLIIRRGLVLVAR